MNPHLYKVLLIECHFKTDFLTNTKRESWDSRSYHEEFTHIKFLGPQ